MFLRRRPPTLRSRLEDLALNLLAGIWAVRFVWGLRQGRLPARRKHPRRNRMTSLGAVTRRATARPR